MTRTSQAAIAPPDLEGDNGPRSGASQQTERSGGRRISLLWWVFVTNGAVLLIALLLLALSPIEIDAPIEFGQLALLLVGFTVLLSLNLVLLRGVLSPLFKLAEVMSSVDPDKPGRRLEGVNPRSAEGAAITEAFNSMLDRLEDGRRQASRLALRAQEAERMRVGRELHDEVGQTLTAAIIQAERAAEGDPALAAQEFARVSDALRGSLDDVRRIARELRPEALDDLGLVNALIALCSRFDAQDGPRVRRQLQGKLPPFSSDVELVIYRVAQESLTNVIRHANATTVTVEVASNAERLVLSIADDGRGMPADLPPDTAGISGMRERAILIGADLTIESERGVGTTVRLTVPIGAAAP